MVNKKKGFTLVELLAVIVILAIILVIAVPQIIRTIDNAREGAFVSSAKLIAVSAEREYLARKTIGDTSFEGLDSIPCEDVVELTEDYESCIIKFIDGKASVILLGTDKFEGKNVCGGTKEEVIVTKDECGLVSLTVDPNGGTNTVTYQAKYPEGSIVMLTIPTAPSNDKEFDSWEVTGEGASVTGNTLTIGTAATTVKAIWKVAVRPVSFSTDSWSTIAAAVAQAEVNNTTYPTVYALGSTKTINMDIDGNGKTETYVVRVANRTKCSEVSVTSQTACGFVVEFESAIKQYSMNSTATNAGGWPASQMRAYVRETIYNKLPAELKSVIINTYVVSSSGSDKTTGNIEDENAGVLSDGNYWSYDKLYLLTPQEVYGDSFTKSDTSNGTSRQLDYYKEYDNNAGVTTSSCGGAIKSIDGINASVWWLRSAASSSTKSFYFVQNSGCPHSNFAVATPAISPAFRIGNIS